MKRSALVAVCVLAVGALSARPVLAGIDSLWADDATLVKQLAELMEINQELNMISDGVLATASATRDMAQLARQTEAAVQELQGYSLDAFWGDLKKDYYNHYPGFQYLESDKQIVNWKGSHNVRSPVKAYELIGAVFGDFTEHVLDLDTEGGPASIAKLERYEAAGALSLASQAEGTTRTYDQNLEELRSQAADAQSAEESAIISTRVALLAASQQSHVIRLLARNVRLSGIEHAMSYAERLAILKARSQQKASLQERLAKPKKTKEQTRWLFNFRRNAW